MTKPANAPRSFREPEEIPLSPEHNAQVSRFVGYPYDRKEAASMRAYARFKKWHWDLMQAASQNIPPRAPLRKSKQSKA